MKSTHRPGTTGSMVRLGGGGGGGDDDDDAAPSLPHLRDDHLAQPVIAPDVHVEDLLECGVRNLEARAVEGIDAGVGHQDVDRPEPPAGLVDQLPQRRERAVALNQRWMYVGPAFSGVGALLLIAGLAGWPGPLLMTLGMIGSALTILAIPFCRTVTHLFFLQVATGIVSALGFPAAIGAQLACPDKLVVDVAGDGSIQMNIQEMTTAIQCGLPVKVVILNNGYLGMVRQWQQLFFDKRYAATCLECAPDFVKLAEAYGAVGLRATKPEEVEPVLKKGLFSKKTVIMDFVVEKEECVYPMVPAGAPVTEMLLV